MKSTKLLKLSMLLLAGAVMFSCSDDEDENAPKITNSLTYAGTEYSINAGNIEDYGQTNMFNYSDPESGEHYNSTFYLTDGDYELVETNTGEKFYRMNNGTYGIKFDLFYPSTSVFGDGEFTYVDSDNTTPDEIKNKTVFTWFSIWFDLNKNGKKDYEEESTEVFAAGGEVTLQGSDKHYVVTFEVPMSDGKTITGSFEGDFDFIKY